MTTSWGAWIAAATVVMLGLAALDAFAPETVAPALLLLLLSIALTRPGFASEFKAIAERFIRG